jgi:hypothetical protein
MEDHRLPLLPESVSGRGASLADRRYLSRCDSKEHSFISTRRIWFCKGCKKQFTVKVGSIFEDSPLGMDKWMFATWLVSNCKNGVSSCEVARHLGITH